jgi:hypothetical protein
MERKQILAFIGAGLLALGVFAPVLTFLGFISISLSNSTPDAIILWALAIFSALLAYKKIYTPLWATGLLALGWVAFRFIYFQTNLSSAMGESATGSPDTTGADAIGAEFAKAMVSMGWGWVVLAAGAVLIIAAAVVKEPEKMAIPAGQ